jgi:hypothetical protein
MILDMGFLERMFANLLALPFLYLMIRWNCCKTPSAYSVLFVEAYFGPTNTMVVGDEFG